MQKAFVEHFEGIGPVHFVPSRKAQRVNIRIKSGPEVRVAFPYRNGREGARKFVVAKRNWIISKLKSAQARQKAFVFGPEQTFKCTYSEVFIGTHDLMKLTLSMKESPYRLHIPASTDHRKEQIQDGIRDLLCECMHMEATVHLPVKLLQLAKQHGFWFSNLSIKKMKTRWGSCSGSNKINLNYLLMILPEYLVEFVLLHELCHTKIKNHGPQFKTLLNQVSGGKRHEYEKELKNYRLDVW